MGNGQLSDDNSITNHQTHFKNKYPNKLREINYQNKNTISNN